MLTSIAGHYEFLKEYFDDTVSNLDLECVIKWHFVVSLSKINLSYLFNDTVLTSFGM